LHASIADLTAQLKDWELRFNTQTVELTNANNQVTELTAQLNALGEQVNSLNVVIGDLTQ